MSGSHHFNADFAYGLSNAQASRRPYDSTIISTCSTKGGRRSDCPVSLVAPYRISGRVTFGTLPSYTLFRPTALIGVEVEGHRMYINGYSRHDYAKGYIQDLPNTEFHIQDYRRYSSPASIITAWYPFVTPAPVLAWRLPLSLLAPHDLFSQVMRNLQPHGLFLMINHGRDEASIATSWCRKVGLANYGSCELRSNVRPRLPPPVLSCWMRAPV